MMHMRRRNLMIAKKQEGLPNGYQEVEYIQSTGTQWIDTGIKQAKFVHEIRFSNTNNRDLMGNSALGGQYWGANSKKSGYEGPGRGSISLSPLERRIVVFNNLDYHNVSLVIGGYTISRSAPIFNQTYHLFAIKGTEYRCNAKLYGFLAYNETDELIANYAPAIDPSGVPCFYDTVTEQPFYNAGTGEFGYELADGTIVLPK